MSDKQEKEELKESERIEIEEEGNKLEIDKKEYDELVSKAEKLDSLEKESKQYKKEYLYLLAELENFKKRSSKEKSELQKYGSQDVFISLLDIVDNFERATNLEATKQNMESFVDGIKLLKKMFHELLDKFNVNEVPVLGKLYDPNSSVVLNTEISDSIPDGHVSQVLQKPYKLHDKVIRTGQVIVVKNDATSSKSKENNKDDMNEKEEVLQSENDEKN